MVKCPKCNKTIERFLSKERNLCYGCDINFGYCYECNDYMNIFILDNYSHNYAGTVSLDGNIHRKIILSKNLSYDINRGKDMYTPLINSVYNIYRCESCGYVV